MAELIRRAGRGDTRRYLRADSLIEIGPPSVTHPWPEVDLKLLRSKPVFTVAPPDYSSEDFVRFVRRKLGLMEGDPTAEG